MRLIILLITILPYQIYCQGTFQIAVLKYNGGGDIVMGLLLLGRAVSAQKSMWFTV